VVNLVIKGENEFGWQASFDGGKPSTDKWGDFNLGTPSLDYNATSKSVTLRLKSKYEDSYDLQMQVDHGRFKNTLFKNGTAVHPPDYSKSGMGPFDDALD
jgi:hypothetical protein